MNKQAKSLMEDLMSDYIRENVEDIWFLDLIEELSSYGTRNTDRAIAFGLCLIHNVDNYRIQAKAIETETIDVGFKYYQLDRNGLPKIIK